MPLAFNYPAFPIERRHGPQGYAHYASYRPWLRDEFQFRCIDCLVREQWGRVSGEFDLDHFLPQRLSPNRTAVYDNLLYGCAVCNLAKSDRVVPDPLATFTAGQVLVHDDGAIEGLTAEADRLIRMLDLDDEEHRRWRRIWIRIIELAHAYDPALYRQLMGYRDDLPDLSRLRPPGGNTRPRRTPPKPLRQTPARRPARSLLKQPDPHSQHQIPQRRHSPSAGVHGPRHA